MSSGFTSFVTNAHEVSARLDKSANKLKDPKEFLTRVREMIREQEVQVWATDGAALEASWKALVQPERKFGGRLMVDTGDLLASMTDGGTVRGTTLRFHPKPFYGRFHQFGTQKMDARPFSGVSDETFRQIQQMLQDQIEEDLST